MVPFSTPIQVRQISVEKPYTGLSQETKNQTSDLFAQLFQLSAMKIVQTKQVHELNDATRKMKVVLIGVKFVILDS